MRDLMPFLMFCGDQHGKAEDAIHWYCSIFDDSRITTINRYGPGDNEPEGAVRVAKFEVGGHAIRAIDSAAPHAFTFTPAIALWIECSSLDKLERASTAVGAGGTMLMPPDNCGFSARSAGSPTATASRGS